MIEAQYQKFVALLSSLPESAVENRIGSGLSSDDIERFSVHYGLSLTDDIRDLYLMVDVSNVSIGDLSFPFYFNYRFLALDEALNERQFLLDNPSNYKWMHKEWLPIFADGMGSFMLTDLNLPGGCLIDYDMDGGLFDDLPVVHNSLAKVIEFLCVCFERGAISSDGYVVQFDIDAIVEVGVEVEATPGYWASEYTRMKDASPEGL